MTPKPVRTHEAIQWLPAEHLGQQTMDGSLRPWLIGKGLLSLRLRSAHGARLAIHLVDQWTGLLSDAHKLALRVTDNAALYRDVEMSVGGQVWVFEQTLLPDSTLSAHPWLAELGDAALGETLADLSNLERSSYEYAWLPGNDAAVGRALRDAQVKPAGLWARRTRIALRGAPLIIQDLFLPTMGRL